MGGGGWEEVHHRLGRCIHKWTRWKVVGRRETKRKLKRENNGTGGVSGVPTFDIHHVCSLSLSRNFMLTTICFLNFFEFHTRVLLISFPLPLPPPIHHPSPALSHLYGIFLFNSDCHTHILYLHLFMSIKCFCMYMLLGLTLPIG